MSNTIKLKNYLNIFEEYTATAVAINPGMLLEVTSAGTIQKHSTAGGNVLPIFALEDELQGGGIDTAYAVSSKIQCWIPQRGDQVYAVLADGQTAVIGSFLESNGDGYLRVYSADSTGTYYHNQIVGQALEALDLSDSSGAESSVSPLGYNKRIKIRII